MRLSVAVLGCLGLIAVACSSSSSNPSIVGEWSTPLGNSTEDWFFNSDGSCGVIVQNTSGQSVCSSGCKYTFNGTNLQVVTSTTTAGTTTSTTYNDVVTFQNGGSSASVNGGCDSSVCVSVIYTRINSNSSTSCP